MNAAGLNITLNGCDRLTSQQEKSALSFTRNHSHSQIKKLGRTSEHSDRTTLELVVFAGGMSIEQPAHLSSCY